MKTLKKRRKQNKTDYLKRLKLLKSGLPRVVFRKTNRYLISQFVESLEARDKIILSVNSKELLKYGWPKDMAGSLKSLTASYLTGFLIGKKILLKKLKNPIVDFGMIKVLHKSKVYGFLKGLIDSGIKINCKEEVFPDENRIKGKHLKKDFEVLFNGIKSKIEGLK
jgi:large subunit ribosomal protein L18